jgi:phenylalanyl-tRNA synthetase beta chain
MKISVAGLTVELNNRYDHIVRLAHDYLAPDSEPDFSVFATDEELEAERRASSNFSFDNGYLESIVLYRKIAEQLPRYNAYVFHGAVLGIDGEAYAFTAKSGVEALAKAFGIEFRYQKATREYFHPGMTSEIFCGDTLIGVLGKVSYEICEENAIEKPVFIAQIDYAALKEKLYKKFRYQPISKFAAEKRGLALVADEALTCGEITQAIQSSCKFLSDVKLFDVYRSEAIGEGKKSMAFNLVFTPTDHEFTSDEIDQYVQKILKKLAFLYQITLR